MIHLQIGGLSSTGAIGFNVAQVSERSLCLISFEDQHWTLISTKSNLWQTLLTRWKSCCTKLCQNLRYLIFVCYTPSYYIHTNDKVVLGEPVETAKSHLIQALDYLSRSLQLIFCLSSTLTLSLLSLPVCLFVCLFVVIFQPLCMPENYIFFIFFVNSVSHRDMWINALQCSLFNN